MSEIVIKLFDNPKLNKVTGQLIELDKKYEEHLKKARDEIYSAFHTRWIYGRLIYENYDLIIEECGTQKEFANKIGESEGVISNNKRGYKYLLDEGCETWDQVKKKLNSKHIKPTVRNFEKIGRLLNEPNKQTSKQNQIEKDRRRLEQLRAEAEEILTRNEPGAVPTFIEDAFEFVEDIEEIIEFLEGFDPLYTGWKSEKYLNFIRNYGYDIITGEQCERCDPHHTTPSGGSGPTGAKLPDYYCIPVSRKTHNAIEEGRLNPHPRVILEAQFRVLSSFLTLNLR